MNRDEIRNGFWSEDPIENAGIVWQSLNNFVSFEFDRFRTRFPLKFLKSRRQQLPKLVRTWSVPSQRTVVEKNFNQIIEDDLDSTCSLNEVLSELKRCSPKRLVRSKCEYYGRAKSPDVSELDLQACNHNNTACASSSSSSTSANDEKYNSLAHEVAELKKQVAFLMSAGSSMDQQSNRKTSMGPPPPPPPPPPPTPILFKLPSETKIRRKSQENKKTVRLQMSDVLKNLQEGKANLKPVCQSSPKGTPRKNSLKYNHEFDTPADSIAEALRKKFANVKFDSPLSDCENSFNQKSFDSEFDDSFGRFNGAEMQNSQKFTIS